MRPPTIRPRMKPKNQLDKLFVGSTASKFWGSSIGPSTMILGLARHSGPCLRRPRSR